MKMTTNNGKSAALRLIPLFFCFAVMGFIDIVGVATNYVKVDFNLSDTVANLLPSMSLIWFLLISIPSAALMNRIGRKNTVLLSLVIMAAALVLPVNDVSALMITGVTGGAVLPPVMGIVSDNFGFMASFSVPFAAIVVMVLLSFVLGRKSA